MHLTKLTILAAAGLAHIQAATIPPKVHNTTLVLLESRPVNGGVLETWGLPTLNDVAAFSAQASEDIPTLHRRCGSNNIFCDGNNLAYRPACERLLEIFDKDQGRDVDPRALGLWMNYDIGMCAVSWHHTVPGLKYGHLVKAGYNTFWECFKGRGVSGYATDVNLNGVCTVQCLSSAGLCFRFDQ